MKIKLCKKCNIEKLLSEFYIYNDKPITPCKECKSKYLKEYQEKNKDNHKKYMKQWYQNHRKERIEYAKKWNKENKNKSGNDYII